MTPPVDLSAAITNISQKEDPAKFEVTEYGIQHQRASIHGNRPRRNEVLMTNCWLIGEGFIFIVYTGARIEDSGPQQREKSRSTTCQKQVYLGKSRQS
jgi:hypothetical protein